MEVPMELIETKVAFEKRDTRKKRDRRCCPDRRKTYTPEYFSKGGKDRRNGKERRYVWYMTM